MTKAEAQQIYREAWRTRCLAVDRDTQRIAEQAMDAVQGKCVDSGRPGPEWEAFIDTLPGYREHWAGLKLEADEMYRELERKAEGK